MNDRPLRAFAVVGFAYFVVLGLITTYAPLWFKSLGLPALLIGLIASVHSWARLLAPYAWGWLADHSGRRIELMRLAAVWAALGAVALAVTAPWGLTAVLVSVTLLFLCFGAIVPMTEAAMAHHLNTVDGIDTARYARVRVWGSIGFIVGVVTLGVVFEATGVSAFPALAVGLFLVLVVAVWRLPMHREVPHASDTLTGVWPVLRQREVAWFFAALFFTVLSHASLYAFLSLYLDSLGHSKLEMGLLWALATAVEVVFFWFQGRWFARFSVHGWLLVAAGTSVLRFAAMAMFGDCGWVLVVAQMSHALTFAAQHAACITLIYRYFPGRLRGRGQALYVTLGDGAAGVVGGVVGGVLVQSWGYSAVFWAASGAALVAVVCVLRSRSHARERVGPVLRAA